MKQVPGFFAFPSKPPSLVETIGTAVNMINMRIPLVHIRRWDQGRVVGKIVVDEIRQHIDEAEILLADLTGLNPNVMFELGYAVARKKRIWIVLDASISASRRDYEQLQILTGVGYAPYKNSEDIFGAFLRETPYLDLQATIFARAIEPNLLAGERSTLLYLRTHYETEADRRLTELVTRYQRLGLPTTVDDPREARVNPLAWYGQKVYSSVAVLAHLSGEKRERWEVHNARYAFVCGLAYGLDKPVLMLSEQEYDVPFDYQGLLLKYSTASECVRHAEQFLERAKSLFAEIQQPREIHLRTIQLATELKGLRIGEYVAENEIDQLGGYFVETAAYREALDGRHVIFIGRRGSGKTANLIQMSSVLRDNRRNLVVNVQPVGYDLEAVVRLLKKYRERDAKGYLVESLWTYLLYTEVARAAVEAIQERLHAGLTSDEVELLGLMDDARYALKDGFGVRLERATESIMPLEETGSVEATRVAISEALHERHLRDLRALLGRVLAQHDRVIVLIDNLDKAWQKNGDLDHLSDFLLGLFTAVRRIPLEFRKSDFWRRPVKLGLTVFLRSDIFYYVLQVAREPDKISYSKIVWDAPATLLRVIEQRFVAAQGTDDVDPQELWGRYFCQTVRGIPVQHYITAKILPRPRDIVYITRAALASAVNKGHTCVEEDDVLEAERQYSQYALEAIEVEGGVTIPQMRDILYEFLGATEIVDQNVIRMYLDKVGIAKKHHLSVIDSLCALSFLGVEVRLGDFESAGDEDERHKLAVMARKLVDSTDGVPRYKIHPAFHSYLEVGSANGH